MKDRIQWIDQAKGLGIILVIAAHIGVGLPIRLMIYSFHMPLFFFLSGYTYTQRNSIKEFLLKKMKSLIVPYFIFGGLICLFESTTVLNGQVLYYDIIKLLVQKRSWTLWFLTCLFGVNVLFFILRRLIDSTTKIFFISVTISCAVFGFYKIGLKDFVWNFDISCMALPYFVTGYYAKENQIRFEKNIDGMHSFIIAVLICTSVLLSLVSYYLTGEGLDFFRSHYGLYPFTMISAFIGIFLIAYISRRMNSKCIGFIGKNSIIFFAIHQSVVMPIVGQIIEAILKAFGLYSHDSIIVAGGAKAIELILVLGIISFVTQLYHNVVVNRGVR